MFNNIGEFLSLLEQSSPKKKNMYFCPAHHDTNESLSVKEKDGKILLKCFSGCEYDAILKALKLEPKDLFLAGASGKQVSETKIAAIYKYKDANGKPFEVVRTVPKGFYQRQPDGNGGYINNLRGIVPTLYHCDEVLSAIKVSTPVMVVEGEKDADHLRSLGFTATTNPMGAGKWHDAYADILKGGDVILIPDNDPPGQEHTEHVAASCYGKASRLRVLTVPGRHKDISDWLNNGGSGPRLEELLDTCVEYVPPPPELPHHVYLPQGVLFNLTDLGNAERLVESYGDIIRYNYERKRWLSWTGRVWEWDSGHRVHTLAKKTVRSIYEEAANTGNDEERKKLVDHAKKSESDTRIGAMINLACSEDSIPVKTAELDKHQWYFNCLNGTIDLTTGRLMPHNKDNMLTVLVPIEYSPDAECPLWLRFLDRITGGDVTLVDYLQRAVGYSLTGDIKNQVLFFLYGLGCNGKSTFVATIRKLLGDYGERVNTDLFMLKDKNIGGGPKEGLANLDGKRFVVASELEDGRCLAVSLIKDMTGGETIKADRKYEHEFEYQPTFKLWLVGNHKPVIKDTTLSIWRRVKQVPFTVTIPDDEIDPELPTKLEAELSGILAWAVRGCLAWQMEGLCEPQTVTMSTASYRQEQDILGDFIEDCCVLALTASVAKSELKDAYQHWCQDNGTEPVTQRTFKNRLIEKSITEGRIGKARYWRGIALKSNDDDKTDPGSSKNGENRAKLGDKSDELNIALDSKVTRVTENPYKFPYKENTKYFMENSVTLVTPEAKSPKMPSLLSPVVTGPPEQLPDYPDSACPKCGAATWRLSQDCKHYICEGCEYVL